MDENKVIMWLWERLDRQKESLENESHYNAKERIQELRAIADEAELMLINPNWPSNE